MTANSKTAITSDHRIKSGQIRKAKTRVKIIEAAFQVFSEKGLQSPNINDFISASGVARGTFYNHFSDTEELLDATIIWLNQELHESINKSTEGITPPIVRLGMGIRLWFKIAQNNVNLCCFIAHAKLRGSGGVADTLDILNAAIEMNDVKIRGHAAAIDLLEGASSKAMRYIYKNPENQQYCNDITYYMLRGIGTSESLLEEIFALPIPKLVSTINFIA